MHFDGTQDFNKKFQNNEALCQYEDSMIETRSESILENINVRSAMKMEVDLHPEKTRSPQTKWLSCQGCLHALLLQEN